MPHKSKCNPFRPNIISRSIITLAAIIILADWQWMPTKSTSDAKHLLDMVVPIVALLLAVWVWASRITIEDFKIKQSFFNQIWPPKKGVLCLDDVYRIVDDHWAGLHWFYIENEWRSHGERKRIIYANWFMTHHKDFLRRVVSRVRPGTHVDESILKRIGFTQSDIGKDFGKPLDQDAIPPT